MFFPKKIKEDDRYKKIIIKYNDKTSSRYSLKTYNKYPFLRNYISKEKFNEILDKANIIIYDAKIKKAKFDKVEISSWVYFLIIISFIFIVLYIILFFYSPRVEKNQNIMKIFGVIFFFGALLSLLVIEGYYSFKRLEGDKTLYDFYKDDIINYIEKVNDEWKDFIIFKFDERSKNIICYIKVDPNDTNVDKNEIDKKSLNKSNSRISSSNSQTSHA
jgi:hypothetical protein